jgi:hypothetical protein
MNCFCRWLNLAVVRAAVVAAIVLSPVACLVANANAAETIDYATRVAPMFKKFCFDCHSGAAHEGDLELEQLTRSLKPDEDHFKWLAVWKNLRAQTMPPADDAQPTDAERELAIAWIEQAVFQLDPARPDPGRVTVRRLNRTEYANTVRDLLGVQFNALDAFPADDTGYGFDVIGDVLSISPLLMEKYVEAAQAIVAKVLPADINLTPQVVIFGDSIRDPKDGKRRAKSLPFAEPVTVVRKEALQHAGPYRIDVEMDVTGSDEASSHTADLTLKLDNKTIGEKLLGWDTSDRILLTAETTLAAGEHLLALKLAPNDPPEKGEKKLTLNVKRVVLHGPLDGSVREYPPQYRNIFFDGPPPTDAAAREVYLRKILHHFAERAFRRPVDAAYLDRLASPALSVERGPKGTFERAVAMGLTVILSSPRFLFRVENEIAPSAAVTVAGKNAAPIDEFALASRLSYLFWSTMPDDELYRKAAEGRLRAELRSEVDRLLDDPRSAEFTRNFVGQWLQTRDVQTLSLDARRLLGVKDSEEARKIFNQDLRRAMREETELLFAHLIEENRPLVDLLTASYSFLNGPLAKFYGIDDVEGREMRKVKLAPDDHRGGLLTQASFLIVTSNPTRTSPVKRGLFILENLLGTPAPPPPADVPPLEAVKGNSKKTLAMREMMELHRREPLCYSCHARMDPLGLALEEFNAIGKWRDEEDGKPIETAGKLITGEKFANVRELSHVIAEKRTKDFYRCLTEKLLTYALGRGVEYYDAPAIDRIVADLQNDGRMRTLLYGIVDSAPFQLRRVE